MLLCKNIINVLWFKNKKFYTPQKLPKSHMRMRHQPRADRTNQTQVPAMAPWVGQQPIKVFPATVPGTPLHLMWAESNEVPENLLQQLLVGPATSLPPAPMHEQLTLTSPVTVVVNSPKTKALPVINLKLKCIVEFFVSIYIVCKPPLRCKIFFRCMLSSESETSRNEDLIGRPIANL